MNENNKWINLENYYFWWISWRTISLHFTLHYLIIHLLWYFLFPISLVTNRIVDRMVCSSNAILSPVQWSELFKQAINLESNVFLWASVWGRDYSVLFCAVLCSSVLFYPHQYQHSCSYGYVHRYKEQL